MCAVVHASGVPAGEEKAWRARRNRGRHANVLSPVRMLHGAPCAACICGCVASQPRPQPVVGPRGVTRMSWFYLIVAGLFEIGWPVGLKIAEDPPSRWTGIAIAVGLMAVSGFLLWLAQRQISIGTAYAVWT